MQIIVQATPLLYQHITDQVFESIIRRSFIIPVTESTDDDNGSELTYQDKNVIHYVGGYAIRHLKKDCNNATLVRGWLTSRSNLDLTPHEFRSILLTEVGLQGLLN